MTGKLLSGIIGFVSSGFGILKLVNLFSKINKIVLIIKETKQAINAIIKLLDEVEQASVKIADATRNGKIDSKELHDIFIELKDVVTETKNSVKEIRDIINILK